MSALSVNLSYNLPAITDKFNERFPEILRIVDVKANPYQVFLKDTRSILGYSSSYVLPTDGKIPKIDFGEGVKYINQYDGLQTIYSMEPIKFDMRITNQLPLTPEDNANIGPEVDMTGRIIRDSMLLALKTSNKFNAEVLTNNTIAQMEQSNIQKVPKADLTGDYIYQDINEKVAHLVANGYLQEQMAIVCTPDTITAYNSGWKNDTQIRYDPEYAKIRMSAFGVKMLPCPNTWMMNKYAFQASKVDATKEEYLPTADAVQVRYLIAPLEAIFWDIAETHSEVKAIVNSPNAAGSFMERIGSIVRDERKKWVFAVTEAEAPAAG